MADESPKVSMDVQPTEADMAPVAPQAQNIPEPTPEFTIGESEETKKEVVEEISTEEVKEEAADETAAEEVKEENAEAIESTEESVETIADNEDEVVEVIEEVQEETPVQAQEPVQTNQQDDLPEGVQKLVEFMKETGGSLEDYAKLNKDYSELSDEQLLVEYYAKQKPHWSNEDIKDHIEDELTLEDYEEGDELDREQRKVLRKRKEEIANAKQFLESQKEKYYENLKLSSQKNATQSDSEIKAAQEQQEKIRAEFTNATEKFFGEGFEGFVFDGGDKKFRIKEQGDKLVSNHMDLNNSFEKHFDENGLVKDIGKLHQAVYAFDNYDKIFSHAYQQGKADAVKDLAKESKNVDMSPKTEQTVSSLDKKPKITMDVTPPGWE